MVDAVHINDDELAADMMADLGDFAEPEPPRADAPPPDYRPPTDPDMGASPADQDGTVVLVNLEYVNETVFLPDDAGRFTGEHVQFQGGHLLTDPATAVKVMAACPNVYEEPKTGTVFGPHPETGFRTRSSDGWVRYNILLGQNR